MGGSGKRPRRSRDEWQRLIEKQAASGQTQAVFCAEHGISVASLQNWKRRLAAPDEAPAPWFELGTLADAKSTGWDIELDLGDGICLRLRRC
jgi:hypothetical protein